MDPENDNISRMIYIFFLTLYLSFGMISLLKRSDWVLDNLITIALLSFIFIKKDYFELSYKSFLIINLLLFFHNLGMFGLYSWSFGFLEYDNLIHFISSLVGTIIIFNMINIKTNGTLFRKEKLLLALMMVGIVTLIGVTIEITEFAGGLIYGEGEGILLAGEGDVDSLVFLNKEIYDDTLIDLIVNLLGAIAGTILIFTKKKR